MIYFYCVECKKFVLGHLDRKIVVVDSLKGKILYSLVEQKAKIL